jgi:hypothetical protein
MKEVFIWTAFRYITAREMDAQKHAEYLRSVWGILPVSTKDVILREIEDMHRQPHWYKDNAYENWRFLLTLDGNGEQSNSLPFYEPFVIYGIKYGVGRMTYVVSMLVEALEPIWGQLSKEAKREIRKHIESHQEKPGGLGMNCDEQHWLAVFRWE